MTTTTPPIGRTRGAAAAAATAALCLALTGCGSAAPPESPSLGAFPAVPGNALPAAVEQSLQSVLDDAASRLPGVAATVIAAGHGLWSGVAGTADGTSPLEPGAKFGSGSLGKTVTAAQVLLLAERGELSLDDPVAQHLPDTPEFDTGDVRIRDLLAMEARVPPPLVHDGGDRTRVWTTAELLEGMGGEPWRRAGFSYSNPAYVVLGAVIEEVTGRNGAQALRDGVLADPRFATIVYQPHERPEPPFALPFAGATVTEDALARGGGYLPDASYASSGGGSGCLAFDSEALALWGYALFGGDLVSTSSLTRMTDTSGDGYGLGIFEVPSPEPFSDSATYANGGFDEHGYSTWLGALPSEGIVITVLANKAGDPRSLLEPTFAQLAEALATGLDGEAG